MVASSSTCRAFMTRSNIVSQIVQTLGFMRLWRMPTARYGRAATVRKAIGSFIFCQQPTQKIGCDAMWQLPQSRERGLASGRGVSTRRRPSNMQRMAQRRERRLVKSLAHRRMGVDGERDVFEARAHFQRQRK